MFRIVCLIALLAGGATLSAQEGWSGQLAPAWELQDQDGKVHALEDYRGRWLIMYFYPRDDTPGCTVEAAGFRDAKAELEQMNAAVVGVSTDDVESHKAFASKMNLNFDLLADPDSTVAEAYDTLNNLMVIKMAKRQTFLIDPDGVIVRHFKDVDPNVHAAQVIDALGAAQAVYES